MKDGLHTYYYKNGSVKYQKWYKDSKFHREDGPAFISYYEDGSVAYQQWCRDGMYHREDGPAQIAYYEDGSIEYQEWYKDGKHLRTICKDMLDAYMKANNVTPAHLFTDPDQLVRNSASIYLKEAV